METLIQTLHSIGPMSSQLVEFLYKHIKSRRVQRGEYLLQAGTISKNIFFIESGLFRCFYDVKEKDVSSWFMKEGDVVISVKSFFAQAPCHENIQALEPALVHYIGFVDLQYIYANFPEFNLHGRLLTEKYYMESEDRLYAIRAKTAAERYDYLLNYSPEFILRVPSKYLASYLGISTFTLSRIRNASK